MRVTSRQIRELSPYLEGDTPTHQHKDGTWEWNLVCPLHQDSKRSASLNVDKGLFYCFVCGGMPITSVIRRKSEWVPADAAARNGHAKMNGSAPTERQRVLSEGMIGGWHSALISNESALRWLKERRGLSLETVKRFEIGSVDGKYYSIPIRGPEGEIWNVRYYNPNPQGERRKIWSEKGYGSPPRLYPMAIFDEEWDEILIGGGEWDIMLTIQSGFKAVTRTAGEDYWDASWGEYFKDKIVYLAHDADDKGQKANRVVGRALMRIADVRTIKFPYDIVKKHGKDLTDFLLEHMPGELRELMDSAEPFVRARRERQPEVETLTVLDTFDSRRVGDPVRVIVTVKGRKEPGYTIPRTVNLACTQKAGAKCLVCPMNAAGGEAQVKFDPDDPAVLAMIDAPASSLAFEVASAYGVPSGKCHQLQQEVVDHQAVEILFARPALDYSDGTKAGEYKNIKITSVGRHDTLANNTVSVVGALQPNPRSQGNEFLAHDVRVMETSVDRFEVTGESIALMKRFQGRRPLNKLAEIDRDLSEHVTHIHGRAEMHAVMDLTFHSLLSFKFAGELVPRGWIESLILGDTGTGKSTAANRLITHYGAGELVTCEAATFAGIVGGVQQLGGQNQWAVTWGVIPQNDRRFVALDEVSGLTTDDIGAMSDIRSSGQAKLTKIQQEVTWARCRLLWMGNPRGATMDRFTYGVDALKPLIGNAEDIARFDMAMAVTKFDVPSEMINQRNEGGSLRYTSEACHQLLMWAWTRQPDQVIWAPDSEEAVFAHANEMGKLYIEEPPLILASSVRIKIARLAVALAARTFSTDKTYENVVVTKAHVDDAVRFLNLIYGMTAFGYRERSREYLADRAEALGKQKEMEQYLKGRPGLAKFLRGRGSFRRQDVEEILNYSREEANGVINTLWEARMVRKELGDIRVEPTLHALLREVKW